MPGGGPVAADRSFLSTPEDGLTVRYGQLVLFAWPAVAGVTQYGFEFTGVNRQFAAGSAAASSSPARA